MDNLQGKNKKTYKYDRVISKDSTQSDVYEITAKPIINDVLNGFNGTIFAYGQTASGKTYTMEGLLGDVELEGIIPRLSNDIFEHIESKDKTSIFTVKVSTD